MSHQGRLREVALLFLKLGTIAFGGPAAHIAMMEDEVVRRRGWVTRERFLDLLAAANVIPGPSSTELAIYLGHVRAGWPGLAAGGICFILPAALIVCAIAWAYVRFAALPAMAGVLYGVKPVVVAVILQALWHMGRTALRTPARRAIAAGAAAACLAGANQLAVLAAAGVVALLLERAGRRPAAPAAATLVPFGLWPLFWVFLKIGAVLFGSGYVLLAFLRADLVDRLGWLGERQLLDAVAVGQVTPGPVFTTATFIGYLLGRGPGAVVATVAIFLPGFLLVALSGPLLPRLRRSPAAGAFLDGVVAASLALMGVVSWQLGRAALVDPLTVALAAAAALALLRYRVNSAWLVLAAALLGWLRGALA
jgi:chromate transporter